MSLNSKILIVDDESRMCESLEILLSNQGYEISTANSGNQALGILSNQHFDLALLDLFMPDMRGEQLMDELRAKFPETLVIVITGHASLDSAVWALRRGAYDYLKKPFEYEELLKRVQNALDQKRLKSEKEIIGGKLEMSEERYRYLVHNSPDIIYTLDADGNFTFISDVVERLLGFRSDELIGRPFSLLIHEQDLERKWSFRERRTGERASSGIEMRLNFLGKKENSGDNCLWVELKTTGMWYKPNGDRGSRFLGTHGVIRDISDRKRLEVQLNQARKMEAIGTLAGGIAHDFNNLLMGVQGYTSLMLLGIDSAHPHYHKLKSIENYTQSGAELTRQLLGFARGGKYDINPIDVNELIQRTSQMFGRTKKEITIHKNLQRDLWSVDADKGQIEQVLLNLYVNAWQAMPGGGDIYLCTENAELFEHSPRPFSLRPGAYVMISVSDRGVGMDEKTLERIFEPFFTTKKMGRGTGLGLASAYGIIKNHNGVIQVKSKKGLGTTFDILLPASNKPVAREIISSEKVWKGHETVLLVDDEEMIIDVASEIIKMLGYKVISAKNGNEALDIYAANMDRIDIILLDMIMPVIGGGETFDAIKKINPKARVLLSSGYSLDGEASEILGRGCDGFIQKPFDINHLSQKLRKILDAPKADSGCHFSRQSDTDKPRDKPLTL